MSDTVMKLLALALAFALVPSAVSALPDEEGSDVWARFDTHEPMYFLLGEGTPPTSDVPLTYTKFQISFRYQLIDFHGAGQPVNDPARGLNLAYTQASYWDLESRSQPFYDSSFKPALFGRWEKLGNGGWSWVHRLHLEGGYEHHSNGRDGYASRSIETLYFKPTFVWRLFGISDFVFEPKMWTVFDQSALNEDITDYWGNLNLQLTWRADFGLQIRTHTVPAEKRTTFNAQITYPMNRLWRPLNFYAAVDYWDGSGEVFLDYWIPTHGWLFGIALSR